jgi:sortase (surface protein transpeptidase)
MMFKRFPTLLIALGLLLAWAFSTSQRSAPQAPPRASRVLPVPRVRVGALSGEHSLGEVDANAAPPSRIQIPAIGVSAKVIALGLNRDGTIQTPKAWDEAGWYEPGPEPGERGPAVVVGHVDSKSGPAVFYKLRALRRGDVIRIGRGDGTAVRFRVQQTERWPKSDFPTRRVYGPTSGAALRLVTCSGNFNASTGHYVENTIVYAARI